METKRIFVLLCLLSSSALVIASEPIAQSEPVSTKDAPIAKIEPSTPKAEEVVKITKSAKNGAVEPYVVIDAEKIIADTGLDKEPMKELKALQQKFQNEIQEIAGKVMKMEQELKAKASTLSPEALKEQQAQLEEEGQKVQLRLNRANNDLRAADMQAKAKIGQQLQQLAQETLVDKQGHKIVFERSGGIVALSKEVDKSAEITKLVKADMAKKAKEAEAKKKETQAKNGKAEVVAAKNGKAVAKNGGAAAKNGAAVKSEAVETTPVGGTL